MEEIMKLIKSKPRYDSYYLIEERGDKKMEKYIENINAKNATQGYLVIYDEKAYMFTFKTIYKNRILWSKSSSKTRINIGFLKIKFL